MTGWSLQGRTALVTGAGSGIGRGIAVTLAEAGAHVYCTDVDLAAAEETQAMAAPSRGGAAAIARQLDVSRRDAVADIVAEAASGGRLDIMCNCAGVIIDEPILEMTEAALDRVLAVNLKGVLFGCQEAGTVMKRQGSGSIVNIASGAIDEVSENLVAYSISKAGVVQITRGLATTLGPHGVRVNAVAPGVVETRMTERHYAGEDGAHDESRRSQMLAGVAERTPLRRIGTAEEMGDAVHFLASDASSYVTGQVLRVNGGLHMPW